MCGYGYGEGGATFERAFVHVTVFLVRVSACTCVRLVLPKHLPCASAHPSCLRADTAHPLCQIYIFGVIAHGNLCDADEKGFKLPHFAYTYCCMMYAQVLHRCVRCVDGTFSESNCVPRVTVPRRIDRCLLSIRSPLHTHTHTHTATAYTHNCRWMADITDADGLVSEEHCTRFLAVSAQTENLRILFGQVAKANDPTLQRVFSPVIQTPTDETPFKCPLRGGAEESHRQKLVAQGLFTVKEFFAFVATLCLGLIVLWVGKYLAGTNPSSRRPATQQHGSQERTGKMPAAAAQISCLITA